MNFVIIGNGIAGISAARVLRQRDEAARIIIIGDETPFFYARTALMWSYMRQLTRRDLEPYERWYWEEMRFELLHRRVDLIAPERHLLTLDGGEELVYDRLLLATGSSANRFDWPGRDLDGVCTFTTIQDLEKLQKYRPGIKKAIVVGGGLIGIELVEIFLHHGVEVSFLIREPWYFELALSAQEAELVHRRLLDHGCQVVYNDEIQKIQGKQGRVEAVITRQGLELPCDVVGLAVGVHPRIDLARASGIECGRGIVVNRSFETSAKDIWAAGDCIEMRDPGQDRGVIQALWYTARRHGVAAARAMVGDQISYEQGIPYNSAQFFFLDYVTVGWMKKARPDLEEFEWLDKGGEHSVRIAHDRDLTVKGFSLLGPRYDSRVLVRWINERKKLEFVRKHLPQAAFNEEFSRVAWKGLV